MNFNCWPQKAVNPQQQLDLPNCYWKPRQELCRIRAQVTLMDTEMVSSGINYSHTVAVKEPK